MKRKKKEIVEKWLDTFAPNIDMEELLRIHVYPRKRDYNSADIFLYHVITYGLINAIEEQDAYNEYLALDKTSCYEFGSRMLNSWIEEVNLEENSSLDLKCRCDHYIVSTDFSWAFIKTHDLQCFFLRKQ